MAPLKPVGWYAQSTQGCPLNTWLWWLGSVLQGLKGLKQSKRKFLEGYQLDGIAQKADWNGLFVKKGLFTCSGALAWRLGISLPYIYRDYGGALRGCIRGIQLCTLLDLTTAHLVSLRRKLIYSSKALIFTTAIKGLALNCLVWRLAGLQLWFQRTVYICILKNCCLRVWVYVGLKLTGWDASFWNTGRSGNNLNNWVLSGTNQIA